MDNAMRTRVSPALNTPVSLGLRRIASRTGTRQPERGLPEIHGAIVTRASSVPDAMVVNTSFNDNNEPIVASPQDAIACFLKTDVDALALGPFWVEKPRLEEETK